MTYKEQLDLWVKGEPVHNEDTDECCPDFSCCRGKDKMESIEVRQRFAEAFNKNDEATMHEFLICFLFKSIEDYAKKSGKKIYIAGETISKHHNISE